VGIATKQFTTFSQDAKINTVGSTSSSEFADTID